MTDARLGHRLLHHTAGGTTNKTQQAYQKQRCCVLTLLSSKLWGSAWRENFLPRECVLGVGCGVLGCSGGYWAWADAGVAGVDAEVALGVTVLLRSSTDWGSPIRISSSLWREKRSLMNGGAARLGYRGYGNIYSKYTSLYFVYRGVLTQTQI